jgi:hypothetical protein
MTSSGIDSENPTGNNGCERHVSPPPQPPTYLGLVQEFGAKLVLEVFGGGGAIWGFSEVCGLRTNQAESIRFWRSVAISVAVVFGARWIRQLQQALSSLSQHCDPNEEHHRTDTRNPITPNTAYRDRTGGKSPIGIQLSSFLFGSNEEIEDRQILGGEEETFLSSADSYLNESTALTPKN